jgi:aquaporin Z
VARSSRSSGERTEGAAEGYISAGAHAPAMDGGASKRYLAEFVGTFGLLLFGGGTAVFTLAPGAFDPLARVAVISLAFGFVLAALAYLFGDLSGAHFNPAVTVSMAVAKRLSWRDVLPYVLAQLLGAIVGIAVVAGIAEGNSGAYSAAQSAALASQCYAWSGAPAGCAFSLGSVFLLELALAFVFVLVILRVTHTESSAKNLAPLAIGLTLLVGNLVAIPIDGASMNPVRSFAPALLSAGWSGAQWAIQESWVFWVAPILGGIFAALVDRLFRAPTRAVPPAPGPST